MATLKLSIKEELVLNGKDRGSENVISIAGVTQVFNRIVTCIASQDTTIATFHHTGVYSSDGALFVTDSKYIRVTNLDAANEVVLSLQIAAGEASVASETASIVLAAGQSFLMGTGHESIAVGSDTTVITDTDVHDLESIIVDPKGNAVDIEVFIAS
jgi:hypothetical protein